MAKTKTKLELSVMLREESGIDGDGPDSTLNQIGEYKMIVNWIDRTYERIQGEHEDWQFLRASYASPLTIGTGEYTTTESGLTDHEQWLVNDVRCYLTALGADDEQEIFFVPWEEFRRTYIFGTQRTQAGRPIHFTIKPDDSIQYWPIPDKEYTIIGEYYKSPAEMTADDDVPVFPGKFHTIVMWGALYYYGANYVEHDKYTHGKNEYHRLKHLLEINQRPSPSWGEPLA